MASEQDPAFNAIMNGDLKLLLTEWKRDHFVDNDLLKLFHSLFQYEEKRIDLQGIKNSKWLQN